MQLVDSKLYIANLPALQVVQRRAASNLNLISRLKAASASTRLLALMLAALLVAASPALLGTIRSAVALALQILLQVGHFGFIAFQIFGR
ncbi:MAG: hypothetical protein JO119_00465 [Acidobacteria bacterium]|nr:hypothetical protein [Acidobacteriota bacterium]